MPTVASTKKYVYLSREHLGSALPPIQCHEPSTNNHILHADVKCSVCKITQINLEDVK